MSLSDAANQFSLPCLRRSPLAWYLEKSTMVLFLQLQTNCYCYGLAPLVER
jgi:hypothetical protein